MIFHDFKFDLSVCGDLSLLVILPDRYLDSQQQGVDPNLLAAQLEGIKERMSPGVSPNLVTTRHLPYS